MSDLRVTRLRVEHLVDPVVDTRSPRFSWVVESDRNGARQVSYRVRCASSATVLAAGGADIWDSGRVESSRCWLVGYEGPVLTSRQRVHWSVTVWDDTGAATQLEPAGVFEMGLLDPEEWGAQWIAPLEHQPCAVAYLRTSVQVDGPVARARAYVTALGLYELRCNGVRVGDAYFTPGWTDYTKRLHYQTLDLTGLVREGENEIVAVLAEGWYAGYVGFVGDRAHYGEAPELKARIEIDSGERLVVVTDDSWQSAAGPIVASDMLMGETQVLSADVDDWQPVRIGAGAAPALTVSPGPPVRVLEEIAPVAVTRTGPSTHLVDLGQNISGWLRVRVSGSAGAVVEVRHAEVLDESGALYLDNLRAAKATDSYTLAGGDETCEPHFTFHGFRYAEMSGHPGDLTARDVAGIVVGSDIELIGDFACSDDRVNQLHSNIVWGARGNFLEVPTDCPQRDERLGWMGDGQVFAPTACALFDTAAFFTKWLLDIADSQSERGGFPNVAPRIVDLKEGFPGWGDAGVIVPWVVAARYADREALAAAFPSMLAWVRFIHGANPGLLWLEERSHDLGDWLHIDAETDRDLIATAFFAWSTRLTARAADALDLADALELHELADGISAAFRDTFISGGGQLKSDTQTAYSLALRFGLVPDELVPLAVNHLVADIERRGMHISTGFLGVAHVLPALSAHGRTDIAYRLLHQDTFPSWLHAVDAGATTIWERWDGWTAEKGFQNPEMNSFNHYAFGAVGEWLYETVAGITLAPFDPTRLRIAPQPDASLRWARAHTHTPVGRVAVAWARDNDGFTTAVDVPVGATASVILPTSIGAAAPIDVGSGHHEFRSN